MQASTQLSGSSKVELVDEAVSLLRERIYLRQYPAGSRLRQEHLAIELGIGRTPIREALRALEQEGLVQVDAGQGARVVDVNLPSLISAYQVRAVIDGLAARLAAERELDASWFAHVRRTIAEQESALDPWDREAYTRANVDFHAQIAHMSNNEFVVAQLNLVRVTTQVFAPVALLTRERAVEAVAEHRAVVEAIEARDTDRAEAVARRHIQRTIDRLREVTAP